MEKNDSFADRFMNKLKIFCVLMAILLFAIYFYARYFGTTGLVVNEIKIVNKKIPDSFNGLKIVHFSDLHYGRTINEKELKVIIKQINKIEPDIVIFTGDLIDKDIETTTEMVTILTEQLNDISVSVGKYAVIGNHDYNNKFYKKIMSDSEFNLLINNYDITYYKSLYPIFIGGLGNYTHDKADIGSIMSYFETNEELYTVIIMHEPDYMKEMVDYKIDLVLAGHSHNGQVQIPMVGKLFLPKGAKVYSSPHYKIGKTDLYISSGIGCSTANVRLFNRPTINFYRLSNK